MDGLGITTEYGLPPLLLNKAPTESVKVASGDITVTLDGFGYLAYSEFTKKYSSGEPLHPRSCARKGIIYHGPVNITQRSGSWPAISLDSIICKQQQRLMCSIFKKLGTEAEPNL